MNDEAESTQNSFREASALHKLIYRITSYFLLVSSVFSREECEVRFFENRIIGIFPMAGIPGLSGIFPMAGIPGPSGIFPMEGIPGPSGKFPMAGIPGPSGVVPIHGIQPDELRHRESSKNASQRQLSASQRQLEDLKHNLTTAKAIDMSLNLKIWYMSISEFTSACVEVIMLVVSFGLKTPDHWGEILLSLEFIMMPFMIFGVLKIICDVLRKRENTELVRWLEKLILDCETENDERNEDPENIAPSANELAERKARRQKSLDLYSDTNELWRDGQQKNSEFLCACNIIIAILALVTVGLEVYFAHFSDITGKWKFANQTMVYVSFCFAWHSFAQVLIRFHHIGICVNLSTECYILCQHICSHWTTPVRFVFCGICEAIASCICTILGREGTTQTGERCHTYDILNSTASDDVLAWFAVQAEAFRSESTGHFFKAICCLIGGITSGIMVYFMEETSHLQITSVAIAVFFGYAFHSVAESLCSFHQLTVFAGKDFRSATLQHLKNYFKFQKRSIRNFVHHLLECIRSPRVAYAALKILLKM